MYNCKKPNTEFKTDWIIDKFKNKSEFPNSELIWKSRYENINFENFQNSIFQEILMSDWFIFNKHKIKENQIDRLLYGCKFNNNKNEINVDNFIIKNPYEQHYNIEYKEELSKSLPYVNCIKDKYVVASSLLIIMNETSDEFLNFHNYNMLGEWYTDYNY